MRSPWHLRAICWLVAITGADACSHFAMDSGYGLTARTMDLADMPFSWSILSVPVGSSGLRSSKHGYVGFVAGSLGLLVEDLVFAGINDAGLTCDLNALLGTIYPNRSETLDNIGVESICRWALEGFGSVAEVKEGLKGVRWVSPLPASLLKVGAHWAIRDANGQGIVIEFLDGETQVFDDHNDKGRTGFGIMTNEPPLPWQLQGIRHLQWKQSLARPSVAMPGSWYPDERFQRIHLVKSGLPQPSSYEEAMMQTVHVLNTVTVPMGEQLGTDSGQGSGEGSGDHTQWAVIYDHKNRMVYWRSKVNQNLQRLVLSDIGLESGSPKKHMPVFSPALPWYSDAASALKPKASFSEMFSLV